LLHELALRIAVKADLYLGGKLVYEGMRNFVSK
jgi:hypothetical protein